MDRDRLLLGLASVFAGLTVTFVVTGLAYNPFLLLLSLPFGATTYFLWYQATGRLQKRARRRRERGFDRERHSGFGAGARREAARDAAGVGSRFRGGPGGVGGPTGPGGDGRRRRANANRRRARGGVRERSGPSRAEAYRTLGLDTDADQAAVKRAYRSKVKEVHPDTESGDEESFKRVNRAYERLTD
ncbi:J domain-containing protein [Halobium salinum]|uniref:J domain-containing protein n=1 Tax=Halobium salinum TaxID=1364940 RepID=A0ABD5P9W5_9EURY|nr:J domain-containing protein [Halobium salinum]